MAFRTANPDDPRVIAWNRAEVLIKRLQDERVVAVRTKDFENRDYLDTQIMSAKDEQRAAFNANKNSGA